MCSVKFLVTCGSKAVYAIPIVRLVNRDVHEIDIVIGENGIAPAVAHYL